MTGIKRISLDLPRDLLAVADALATLDGTNRKQWLETQLRQIIKQRSPDCLAAIQKITGPTE